MQNKCVRMAYGVRKFGRISEKFRMSGWLNVRNMFIFHSGCLFHKIITSGKPAYLYNKIKFRTDVHNINIRHRNAVTVPVHRTVFYEGCFSYTVANVYNALPGELKTLNSRKFANRFRELLFAQQ